MRRPIVQNTSQKKPLIGFIGQGFIGKNYADDFENRGYTVIRYTKGSAFAHNKDKIATCDIVFIAVPTPTSPKGFDCSIVQSVLPLVGKRKIAVIKSTLLPGTTDMLQKEYHDIFVFHSPEFLREKTAAYDASHPNRNIVGISVESKEAKLAAQRVLSVLPKAPFEMTVRAKEAELVKYGGNNFLYIKVVYINMLFDLAKELGCRWNVIRDAMKADARIGDSHMEPIHESGHSTETHKRARGAGGHCFIKDFAAFSTIYEELVGDDLGKKLLHALRDKNNDLLRKSGKDIDLLEGVYGTRAKRS